MAGRLSGKEPLVSLFSGSNPLQESSPIPLNRSRFLQTVHIRGFDEPVHILYDFLNGMMCGIQGATIVDLPVPRGLLYSSDLRVLKAFVPKGPETVVPLELAHEQKWSFFNPLHAAMQRETGNEANSLLMQKIGFLKESVEFNIDTISPGMTAALFGLALLAGAILIAPAGKHQRFVMTYPRYIAIAPVGSRTVIAASGSTAELRTAMVGGATTECPSCHAEYAYRRNAILPDNMVSCQNCGKHIPVDMAKIISNEERSVVPSQFAVPSNEILASLIDALASISSLAVRYHSEMPTESKILGPGPLFRNLAAYAASPSSSSWKQFQERVLREETEFAWKQTAPNSYEITGLSSASLVSTTRYAPQKMPCPRCAETLYVSASTMPPGGMLKCYNCGFVVKVPSYIG